MSIYFSLILFILILPLFLSFIKNKNIRNNLILASSLFSIFLLMVFKDPSVGRDIAGYKRIYETMEYLPWSNFDIYWMEWGYEFLMMIFTHIFNMPFQGFMACVYAFAYYSYYCFFKKYSEDFTTSILLYVCFTFFTFDMSAVRNMIGVAICLFSVPYAEKKGVFNFIKFLLIVLIAALIHKSAYIFLAVYFIIKIGFSRTTAILYLGVPAIFFLLKTQLYTFINLYFKAVEESGTSFGGNLIVYIISILVTLFVWTYYKRKNRLSDYDSANKENLLGLENYFENSGLAMRMIYAGIILQLLMSGTVLTRMAQYLQFFILVLIPNNIVRLDLKSRIIVKFILYALAIAYFTKYSLFDNALDIVPYTFFE